MPRLGEIESYQPGRQKCWYETHCFTPDDKKIIFSANPERGQHEHHCDICIMDLGTGQWDNLTNSPNDWDEHAQLSPDGKTIVWMSSTPHGMSTAPEWRKVLRTEYWLMDLDGSNKRRLTFFNESGAPEHNGDRVVCSDSSWSPKGDRLVFTAARAKGTEHIGGGIGMIEFGGG